MRNIDFSSSKDYEASIFIAAVDDKISCMPLNAKTINDRLLLKDINYYHSTANIRNKYPLLSSTTCSALQDHLISAARTRASLLILTAFANIRIY